MRAILYRIVVALPLLMFTSTLCLAQGRPNIIMFAVDDMCDWVSPMGDAQAHTPNMQRLAERGVVFTNAHTAGVFCAPSRSAIFTGHHATKTGCYRNQVYFVERPDLVPLQQNFQESGYGTYGAGKLFHHPAGYVDLRGWDEFHLRDAAQKRKGWDLNNWGPGTPIPQPHPSSPFNKGKQVKPGLFLEWGRVPNDREEDMADTQRTNWACRVIGQKHDKPFFLAVGLYAPHFPNYVPGKYFDLYEPEEIQAPAYKDDDLADLPDSVRIEKFHRSKIHQRLVELGAVEQAIHGYLASVSYADAMLGRVLDALDASPYKDNTIVVLWSDHGYQHGQKGDWGKHTLWERVSNVPFIWAGGPVSKGQVVDTTVSLIDLYPTFIDLCGLQNVGGLDGQSIAPVLRNPAQAKDRTVLLPHMEPGSYALINQKWRYIRYQDGGEELYNVQADPHEWHNLAWRPDHKHLCRQFASKGPKDFAKPGRDRSQLKLQIDGESFRWHPKD